MSQAYARLLSFLEKVASRRYRMIEHAPEGRTDLASALRGHPLDQAAKCIVVEVRGSSLGIDYVLAVIPGDRRVDYRKIRKICGGQDAVMADRALAEELTGCRIGCVIPISFRPELRTIIDPLLLEQDEVFFNAARLDRSVAVSASTLVHQGVSVSPISKVLAPQSIG